MIQGGKRMIVCQRTIGAVTSANRATDKNAAQARQSLVIAAVLDGAARIRRHGSADGRDWMIRFNEQGPDGLINKVCRARRES